MKRPLMSDHLAIVSKDADIQREGERENVETPPSVPRAVLTCRLPEPLIDRLAEAAHHYRKRLQKQDIIEASLDAWLLSKGF